MSEVTGTTWTVYDANAMSQAEIYGHVLCEIGDERQDVVGLTADLAKSTKIGIFGEKFPDRFFNVGIAEQNLFGVAAGMALAGLTPFVSTMAAFASMRACEQVRTDICYQNLNGRAGGGGPRREPGRRGCGGGGGGRSRRGRGRSPRSGCS